MADQYVTQNELDKILERYDRLGAAQVEAGNTENRLRKYIDDLLIRRDQELSRKFNEAVAIASDKAAIEAKRAAENTAVKVTTELHQTFDGLAKKLKESLLSELSLLTKIKTDEIQKSANSMMVSMRAETQNYLGTKIDQLQLELKSEQELFHKTVLEKASTIADDGVKEVLDQTSLIVKNEINSNASKISLLLEELRLFVTDQMNQKLIDKQAIENKMREIEAELIKKTSSIIDFNIEQARNQMESSARAEVKEGIKEAASQLISGLQ